MNALLALWRNISARFWLLVSFAPGGPLLAILLFSAGLLAFILSAIGTFSPQFAGWSSWIVSFIGAMPGPAVVIACLGLTLGPLTFLTFWLDRYSISIPWYGGTRFLLFKRPPVLSIFAAIVVITPQYVSLHNVRVIPPEDTMFFPSQRVTLAQEFQAWKETCAKDVPDGEPVRPIIVAISGGASRAAVWGGSALMAVDAAAPRGRSSIFAISSVSGGSLGTAAYLATLAGQMDDSCTLDRLAKNLAKIRDSAIRDALAADALGPVLAGAMMGDVSRSLFGFPAAIVRWLTGADKTPPAEGSKSRLDVALRGGDRAEALERAFEKNWEQAANTIVDKRVGMPIKFDKPFLSLFYDEMGKPRGKMPLWIANGADDQVGDRVLTVPFSMKTNPFPAARDALALLRADIPISTAIHNTARFPYLSPAGELTPVGERPNTKPTQIVDGGYFENEGMETALELARWLKENKGPDHPVEPIIVQVTADADSGVEDKEIVRCDGPFRDDAGESLGQERPLQLTAPIEGVYTARSGHSRVALREALKEFCSPPADTKTGAFFHFYLYRPDNEDVPLNWVLSRHIADYIWTKALARYENSNELARLKLLLGTSD